MKYQERVLRPSLGISVGLAEPLDSNIVESLKSSEICQFESEVQGDGTYSIVTLYLNESTKNVGFFPTNLLEKRHKFKRPYAKTSLMITIILTSVSLNVLKSNNF